MIVGQYVLYIHYDRNERNIPTGRTSVSIFSVEQLEKNNRKIKQLVAREKPLAVGESWRHPKDQFTRLSGRLKALSRAVKQIGMRFEWDASEKNLKLFKGDFCVGQTKRPASK